MPFPAILAHPDTPARWRFFLVIAQCVNDAITVGVLNQLIGAALILRKFQKTGLCRAPHHWIAPLNHHSKVIRVAKHTL